MLACLNEPKENAFSLLPEPEKLVCWSIWLEVTLKHLCLSAVGTVRSKRCQPHSLPNGQTHWFVPKRQSRLSMCSRIAGEQFQYSPGTSDRDFCLLERVPSLSPSLAPYCCTPLVYTKVNASLQTPPVHSYAYILYSSKSTKLASGPFSPLLYPKLPVCSNSRTPLLSVTHVFITHMIFPCRASLSLPVSSLLSFLCVLDSSACLWMLSLFRHNQNLPTNHRITLQVVSLLSPNMQAHTVSSVENKWLASFPFPLDKD